MPKPPPNRGLARLVNAFSYSVNGLWSCYRTEEAFRLEAVLFVPLLVVIVLLPVAPLVKLLLFSVNTLVLIIELLNSAIEAVVDRASPEHHQLAGRAKDMGSAAVLLSLALAGVVWVYALLDAVLG